MKRAALTLLALLALASPARSEIAVIVDRFYENDASTHNGYPEQQGRMIQAALDVLDKTGACYRVFPINAIKTRFIAEGRVVYGWTGSTYTSSETFDGVLWLNWNGIIGATSLPLPNPVAFNGCYPCSLTLLDANKPVTVPHLLTFGATIGQSSSTSGAPWQSGAGAIRCSTGVNNIGGSAAGHSWAGLKGYESDGWLSASNQFVSMSPPAFEPYGPGTPHPGGVRSILRVGTSATWFEGTGRTAFASNNPDSLVAGLDADTVVVWERPFTGVNVVASSGDTVAHGGLVFANIMGASPCTDSLGATSLNEFAVPCEFDAPTLLVALARLDSLSGGGVWCGEKPYGLRAAVTVSGAFSRSRRDTSGGGLDGDSTATKTTIADIGSLSIPVTVLANIDSVATYPYEKAWWGQLNSNVRYSPQAWTGVVDSTAASGNTASAAPVDVFGRNRARAFYGDGSAAGADSSIHAGLKWLRSLAVTEFGVGKVSGFLVAPMDDYSPRNWYNKSAAPDSLVYAIRQAGFGALRTDVHTRWANPGKIPAASRDRLIGYWTDQGVKRSALDGSELRVLGQTGYSIAGGQYQADTTAGALALGGLSFGSGDISTATVPHMIVARFWHGLVHDTFTDYDWFPHDLASGASPLPGYTQYGRTRNYEDMFEPFRRASILNLYVTDLSGAPNGPPARSGYYALRSIKRQFDAINRLAGRTIFAFTWPEGVRP